MFIATPSEKLAESLDILKKLPENGIVAIKTNKLTRTHRERLLENGFIKEVYQGWYITTPQMKGKEIVLHGSVLIGTFVPNC